MSEVDSAKSGRVPRVAWAMAVLTLVVMGGGGWLLMAQVQHRDPLEIVLGPMHWSAQLPIGIVAGLAIAAIAWRIIAQPTMAEVRARYSTLVSELMPGRWLHVAVSLSAGIGEELLFRGALQHWLGVPLTAIVFVALHGYLDPRDKNLLRYGIFLTVAMCGIGWAAEHFGLLMAMAAHAVIDIVLIRKLVATDGREVATTKRTA